MLTDLVAFALQLPPDAKRQLLEQPAVDCRAELLLEHLSDLAAKRTSSRFPPQFSAN